MAADVLAVGVDGARGGWLAAVGRGGDDVEAIELALIPTFAELEKLRPDGAPVAVDIPMGLLDAVDFRACDRQARRLLAKERRSTVFAPPSRPLLAAPSYQDARALVAADQAALPTAKGVSAQSFGIALKMRRADDYLQANPGAQEWLWECHPELSFRALAGEDLAAKKSVRGQAQRLRLLCDRFPGVLDAMEALPASGKDAEPADALDALVSLHTALRVRAGQHTTLGSDTDAEGLVMRIVY